MRTIDEEGGVLFDEREIGAGPVDARAAFGCTTPADLDVGFGKGMSLRGWAERNREGCVLGIEKRRSFALHALARLDAAARARVRVVRADFRALAPRLGPAGLFRHCRLDFPDPWWKRRHQKRQVVTGTAAGEIARLLAPGGYVFVQTDVPDRAEKFRAAFLDTGAFEDLSGPGGFLAENPTGVRSNREIRCAREGVPVYRMMFRRLA